MSVPCVRPTTSAPPGGHTEDPNGDAFDRLAATSPGLRAAAQRARIVAQVDTPVLLEGETGVGKDAFARAIHESSRHRDGPFVALNCGGLPRDLLASELFGYVDGAFTGARRTGQIGKIEAAHGGTLLLDEIADMPLDLQPYFLRVLEDGEIYPLGCATPRRIRLRLVAACNTDLRIDMDRGRFRRDLFYRVSVTTLHIPPLRERAADIPSLVEHFADDLVRRDGLPRKRFAPSVLIALASHPWPGNLRELRNVVESMMLFAEDDVIGLDSLPIDLSVSATTQLEPAVDSTLSAGLDGVERDAIRGAIRSHGGNLSRTAHDLHISKSTLYLKMKKYALEPVLREVRRTRH